ncbi:CaiB/BaiF CoA transferase family protein [Streptosporangium sp. CA-115845]|uniref:CaiB/BaiF CoA transferase family protein n=1 Tax=Streptosporangium sp. CA-115845 TaxID=3240071 RepID=UPI003D8E2AAF
MSALGPGPFCSMLLADFGAEVIAVERPDPPPFDPSTFFARGKRSAVVDLRAPRGSEVIARLADHADVLLESNRPGTMERHGLGPDVLCARNPRLVYTRLTGWGQDGPYRDRAGHDINYIGVSGALGVIGAPDGAPVPPLALVGDIAGGSMFAALGIMLALFARAATGRGQVVDTAIVDGSALLNTPQLGEWNAGMWNGRGQHILAGAAPFYGVYPCADGGYFTVGAIEPKFYARFLDVLGLDDVARDRQLDLSTWAGLRARVAEAFRSRPRAHWTEVFADIDGCGTPMLDLDELATDPHLRERGTVVLDEHGLAAAPAPRLSRSPGSRGAPPAGRGADTRAVLLDAGFAPDEVHELAAEGTVVLAN